ncbi:MAG: hypothetical protein U9N80_06215 [Chloroflexota bacterium]|nr:hypothetical protein [Chloroflexota bacterium]
MLYVIGGAPRVGKTIIAQEFLERANVPFLSLDLLKMALVKGMPHMGIDPMDPSAEVAGQMWPVVRGLSTTILENLREYLIEGDAILPSHSQELADEFPGKVRTCFLGFENANPSERLSTIRHHPGPEDWLSKFGDHEVLAMIDEMIEYSRQVREDAQARGIPYFEDLGDFGALKERVLHYLVTGRA